MKLTWSNITQTHLEARVCSAFGKQKNSQMFNLTSAVFDNVAVSVSNEFAGRIGNLSVTFTPRQKIPSHGRLVIRLPQGFDIPVSGSDVYGPAAIRISGSSVTVSIGSGIGIRLRKKLLSI